jgi:hypothetical protein
MGSAGTSLSRPAFLYTFKNKLLEFDQQDPPSWGRQNRSLTAETSTGIGPDFRPAHSLSGRVVTADLQTFLRRLPKAIPKIDPKLSPPTAWIGLSPDIIATYTKRSIGALACSMRFTVLPE